MQDVYIVSAVRTAIGAFGGALKDTPACDLAAAVTAEAVRRAAIPADQIGQVIFGGVIQTEPRDAYLARVAGVQAGIPVEATALTVNRLCGSGLQAIITAAQGIMLGDVEVAVAGGAESMSRAPHLAHVRYGARMGDVSLTDALTGVLTDPFHRIHMGVTAENVAERCGVTREEQDALALESHRRAATAIREGRFKEQILPLEVAHGRKTARFDTDEHVRPDATAEDFARARPVFRRENGTVSAANASGINDGAAAVVLASAAAVTRLGLRPLARLVGYAVAGLDPAYMGLGPVPATQAVLRRTDLDLGAIGVIEANEAFAAQACAVMRQLGADPARVNPNGSGISLGHPVGATGAINTVKAVYELMRTGDERALVTMCIGGGQGIAAIFERA